MKRRLIALLSMALVAACSSPEKGPDDNNGWTFNNGTDSGERDMGGVDSGPSDGGEPDMGEPTKSVEFRLVNESDRPVFAYGGVGANNPCGLGSWLQVIQNDEPQRIEDDCTLCKCSESDCAVCAFDCAPGADPDYSQVAPQEVRTFTWDGRFRVQQPDGEGGMCYADVRPEQETLTAQFCWGHGFEMTGEVWGEITDIECQDVEFTIDQDVVEVEILPTARDAVDFVLNNDTNETLYAEISVDGLCQFDPWLRLSRDGQPVRLSPPCGDCLCSQVDDESMCPQPCPAAPCAPPIAEQLEFVPGDSRTFTWDRVAYFDDTVDGIQCQDPRLVAGELTAEFCWGTGFDENAFQLVDRQCEAVVFDPFIQNWVEYDITNAP